MATLTRLFCADRDAFAVDPRADIPEAQPSADDDEDVPAAVAGEVPDDEGADEFLSQLANLSPRAAAAIEATASADETARRLPNGDGDEEINRNLLLKFLSSAKP